MEFEPKLECIKLELGVDPNTFSQHIDVTVRMPLEPLQDASSKYGDEIYSKIGKRLIEIIRSK